MTTYSGQFDNDRWYHTYRDGVRVDNDDDNQYTWGYGGGGPHALAKYLIDDAVGFGGEQNTHQFVCDFVGRLPRDEPWSIDDAFVRDWFAERGRCQVFVYGTLRAGECNHEMLQGARQCGTWHTPAEYTMLDNGLGYPVVIAGGETAIVGEVYEVSGGLLEAIDHLEGVEHGLYRRDTVRLPLVGDCVIYLYAREPRGNVVGSGDWLNKEGASL